MDNYEKIKEGKISTEYKNSDGTFAKTVVLQKKINDEFYYVVEAVPDAKLKSLHITSAYINKKDTFSDVLVSKDPKRYVQDEHQPNVSKDSISHLAQKVKEDSLIDDKILESMARRAYQSKDSKRLVKKKLADEKYSLNKNFGMQLQDWLNGGGKKYRSYNGEYFELGTTPDVLVKRGAPSSEVIMYNDVVVKTTGGKHNISLDEISKLPSQLNDPILLFKGSVPNSFVVLTELKDKNGNDIIVAVHIGKKHHRTTVNKIASIYSKSDDFGNNKIQNYVMSQINNGNLIDASNKKAPRKENLIIFTIMRRRLSLERIHTKFILM